MSLVWWSGWRDGTGSVMTPDRTAIGLRRVLAAVALIGGVGGALAFWNADLPGAGVAFTICAALAIVAGVNLLYLLRRY